MQKVEGEGKMWKGRDEMDDNGGGAGKKEDDKKQDVINT